jgi:hypothetical protein
MLKSAATPDAVFVYLMPSAKSVITHRDLSNRLTVEILTIAALFLGLPAHAQAASFEIAPVALSGQQAPGTPAGVTFSSLLTGLRLNAEGEVLFAASLLHTSGVDATNDRGIWGPDGAGGLALVARIGDPAPGAAGATFKTFLGRAALNDAGQSAFVGFLNGVSTSVDSGVWGPGPDGGLTVLARENFPAPGGTPNIRFQEFGSPRLDAAGGVWFETLLRQGVAGVDDFNDQGLWGPDGAGGVIQVVREGDPAPGRPSGTVIREFHYDVNSDGRFLILGASSDGLDGVWRSDADAVLSLIASEGDPAPGTAGGTPFSAISDAILNAAGDVRITARMLPTPLDPANAGIWVWRESGDLSAVALTNHQAPGAPTGATFAQLAASPRLNGAGEVAFDATLTFGMGGVTGSNDTGVWRSDADGDVLLVAREGDPIADALGMSFSRFVGMDLNDRSELALLASVIGPDTGALGTLAIFFVTASGEIHLVAREGAAFEVASGDERVISTLGTDIDLNDASQIAFSASFTDGSSGVFVAQIVQASEPIGLTALALLIGTFASRRLPARSR